MAYQPMLFLAMPVKWIAWKSLEIPVMGADTVYWMRQVIAVIRKEICFLPVKAKYTFFVPTRYVRIQNIRTKKRQLECCLFPGLIRFDQGFSEWAPGSARHKRRNARIVRDRFASLRNRILKQLSLTWNRSKRLNLSILVNNVIQRCPILIQATCVCE